MEGYTNIASNYAKNAINSTIDWGMSGLKGYGKMGPSYGSSSACASRMGMSGSKRFGTVGLGLMNDFGKLGMGQKSAMGAIGLGALGAGAAAADFLNPWGLGWGD
jgi:hypothetical protein